MRITAVELELAALRSSQLAVRLTAGRFQSVAEVARFVLDLVGRIDASVVRERAHRGEAADPIAARAVYRLALANAEWAFSMIGADPDLARFLAAGSRASCDRARVSCQMLAVLLSAPCARARESVRGRR